MRIESQTNSTFTQLVIASEGDVTFAFIGSSVA